MNKKEIMQLENLGLEEEQIEIYYALVSDLSRRHTSEQAEMLALYIILRADEIANSIFDKDF
ncbi:hypothetical protein EY688_13080 [Enterococcus casseliflavus]|uniref:hypothetical protein n=1 Tax=Enterococcus casseliflavus TaxID=37734 RepID=UPI001AD767EC|nr:hypothetical protein [Enterococcus casseliflavus]MBO6350071.1 hypothetical protein [Enterococcus casseliflavus]MBO6366960.1 hypothetical protein [Enterococcus casseliflavus]